MASAQSPQGGGGAGKEEAKWRRERRRNSQVDGAEQVLYRGARGPGVNALQHRGIERCICLDAERAPAAKRILSLSLSLSRAAHAARRRARKREKSPGKKKKKRRGMQRISLSLSLSWADRLCISDQQVYQMNPDSWCSSLRLLYTSCRIHVVDIYSIFISYNNCAHIHNVNYLSWTDFFCYGKYEEVLFNSYKCSYSSWTLLMMVEGDDYKSNIL